MREQFRIAEGEPLHVTDDPRPRGHSIEFRINGEDAGRGFLPAPGTVSAITLPAGPGVRVDAGVEAGSVVGGQFDSPIQGGTGPDAQAARRTVVVEVGGRRLEVPLPADLTPAPAAGGGWGGETGRPSTRTRHGRSSPQASTDAFTAPMQGTIIKIAVTDGDTVHAGDLLVVLEATKREIPVTAHKTGTITGLTAEPGSSVTQGTILCEIKD